MRYNPFRPGSLVTPGMFSGRGAELLILERVLFQTKNDNPAHFLICGERGIGKSSLLLYLQYVAEGRIPGPEGQRFSFLTVSVALEPTLSYTDLVKKIGAEFQRTIAAHNNYKESLKSVWEFITRWEAFGIKYKNGGSRSSSEPHQLLDDLAHTIHATLEALGGQVDGVLFLVDEADKPASEAGLGEFCKLFTERLSKRACNSVSIGLAGLPETIDKLRHSHESAPRVFEVLHLKPLSPGEAVYVVRNGLTESKEKSEVEVTIAPEAENLISQLSEGYPHFLQEFAYSAFESDKDNVITELDVQDGAMGEHGALQQLGIKYFQDLYFAQIFSDEYRGVLRFMAQNSANWVTKDELRKALKLKEYTLDNALSALKKRRIILPRDGHKGSYRLPTQSFAAWIRAFTHETTPTTQSM